MQAVRSPLAKLFGWRAASPSAAQTSAERAAAAADAQAQPHVSTRLEIYVVGDPERRVQGSHPACHGTLLYLGEKCIELADINFVSDAAANQELAEACGGSICMPVLHAIDQRRWACGARAIWEFAEQQFPGAPDLGRPQSQLSGGEVELGDMVPGSSSTAGTSNNSTDFVVTACVGLPKDKLLATLRRCLLPVDGGSKEAAAEAEASLKATLQSLEDWLAEHELAFIGGDAPDATDCYLVAELMHVFLAAARLKRWDLLGRYPRLARYCEEWRTRGSWQQSHWADEMVWEWWQGQLALQST